MDDVNIVSLAQYYKTDKNGSDKYKRLADIDTVNCKIIPANINENEPYFENRKTIFNREKRTADNKICVLEWHTNASINNPEKDHVESTISNTYHAIEVFKKSKWDTKELISQALLSGIVFEFSGNDILFLFDDDGYTSKGFYIQFNQLSNENGLYKLKEDIYKLPVYKIDNEDIITPNRFANNDALNNSFYRYLKLKNKIEETLIQEPYEIIKKMFIDRMSWTMFKDMGAVRKDYGYLKKILPMIADGGFYKEAEQVTGLSQENIKLTLEKLENNAKIFITNEDIGDKAIDALLLNNPSLTEKYQKSAEIKWNENNKKQQAEAEEVLKQSQQNNTKLVQNNNSLKKQIDEKENRLRELDKKISDKSKTIKELDEAISDKLQEARNNKGKLLLEYSLLSDALDSKPATLETAQSDIAITGAPFNHLNPITVEDWEDLVDDVLTTNLITSGIKDEYAQLLASYLYVAYLIGMPVLLAGPSGQIISDAFSIALDGITASRYVCNGKYDYLHFEKSLNETKSVLLIENSFECGCVDRMIQCIKGDHKLFIFTDPVVETLSIEPKSLFNYMLPIITEPFVQKKPSCDFLTAVKSSDYKEFIPSDEKNRHYRKIISKLTNSLLKQNTMQQVIADVHFMNNISPNEKHDDIDSLMFIFPYSVVTDNAKVFSDYLKEAANVPDELKRYYANYFNLDEQ